MEIKINQEEKGTVVKLFGRLDGVTCPELQEKLVQLLENHSDKIIIDLEELDYVSSAGLRVLLLSQKKIKQIGGQIVLSAMRDTIKEVFDISGFSTLFPIYSSKTEALANI